MSAFPVTLHQPYPEFFDGKLTECTDDPQDETGLDAFVTAAHQHAYAEGTRENWAKAFRKYQKWYEDRQHKIDNPMLPISCKSLETYIWTLKAIKNHSYFTVRSYGWDLGMYVQNELKMGNPFVENLGTMKKVYRAILRIFGNEPDQARPILEEDEMAIRGALDLTSLVGLRADAYISVAKILGRRDDTLKNILLKHLTFFLFDSNENKEGYPVLKKW